MILNTISKKKNTFLILLVCLETMDEWGETRVRCSGLAKRNTQSWRVEFWSVGGSKNSWRVMVSEEKEKKCTFYGINNLKYLFTLRTETTSYTAFEDEKKFTWLYYLFTHSGKKFLKEF